ncbi:hypothetical protein DL546_001734 [Coniochaeta pulveracea]|uniref:Uncharacterized protein n=1 Tax=Coniochaeta pulveracea TaxID=177199 RepID=A0A420YLN7_9PEZI|nr:hypothetical protein DL546_001734 [Coniochaeta pulveracea]
MNSCQIGYRPQKLGWSGSNIGTLPCTYCLVRHTKSTSALTIARTVSASADSQVTKHVRAHELSCHKGWPWNCHYTMPGGFLGMLRDPDPNKAVLEHKLNTVPGSGLVAEE